MEGTINQRPTRKIISTTYLGQLKINQPLISKYQTLIVNLILIITLSCLDHCLSKEQSHNKINNRLSEESCPSIRIVKQLNDQLMEPYEISSIAVNEFVTGPLLDYQVSFAEDENPSENTTNSSIGTTANKDDDEWTIYVRDPFSSRASKRINLDIPLLREEPFPRSTIYSQDQVFEQRRMTFIDKNFILRKYVFELGQQDVIKELATKQLNTNFVNKACQDLTVLPIQNPGVTLQMALCQREVVTFIPQENKEIVTNYQVILQFSSVNTEDIPKLEVRYIYYQQSPIIKIDTQLGLRTLHSQLNLGTGQEEVFFVAMTSLTNKRYDGLLIPGIVSMQTDIFDDLQDGSQKQMMPFNFICYVGYHENFSTIIKPNAQILDMHVIIPIEDQVVSMAFVIKDIGITVFSQILAQNNSENSPDNLCQHQNQITMYIANAIAIHSQHNLWPVKAIFVTSSTPMAVYEINIEDLVNPYVFKIYTLKEPIPKYIGLPMLACNFNFIVHGMLDVRTQRHVLRVYSRNATQLDQVKFQYDLPSYSHPNFYIFPNPYMDHLLLRDEQRVNITVLQEQKLIINATSSNLIAALSKQNVQKTAVLRVTDVLNGCQLITQFNIIFMQKNDTRIGLVNSGSFGTPLELFYNCADKDFSYYLTSKFNGPNYYLKLMNCTPDNVDQDAPHPHSQLKTKHTTNENVISLKYNNIKTQDGKYLKEQSDEQQVVCKEIDPDSTDFSISDALPKPSILITKNFLIKYCPKAYLIETNQQATTDYYQLNLICVDFEKAQVQLYNINSQHSNFDLFHFSSGFLPKCKFIISEYDRATRTLMVFSENIFQLWQDYLLEIHFFSAQDIIKWTNSIQIPLQQVWSRPVSFTYNSISQKGMLIFDFDYVQKFTNLTIFDINPLHQNLSNILNAQISSNEPINKAFFTDQGFLFILFKNGIFSSYETIKLVNGNITVSKVQELNMTTDEGEVHHLDLIKNEYFVVYSGKNTMTYYQVENFVTLSHRGTLPIYDLYKGYSFYSDPTAKDLPEVLRYSSDQYLAVVMFDPLSDHVQLLSYEVGTSQHNSFIMAYDYTKFFQGQKYVYGNVQMMTTNSYGSYFQMLINKNQILVELMVYDNYFKLRPTRSQNNQLITKCQDINLYKDESGILKDWALHIENIYVQVNSMFDTTNQSFQPTDEEKTIKFIMKSQNQGLALIKTPYGDSTNVTYGKNSSTLLLLQDVISGTNATYNVSCNYQDIEGNVIDCTNAVKIVSDLDSNYYQIDFITNLVRASAQYQIGSYYMLFDSQSTLYFMQTTDGMSLALYMQVNTQDQFNCTIERVVSLYQVTGTSFQQGFQEWLLAYQCITPQPSRRTLNLALITVFNDTSGSTTNDAAYKNDWTQGSQSGDNKNDLIKIQTITGNIDSSQNILDINFIYPDRSTSTINTTLIITYDNPGSYTNLLMVYNMLINLDDNSFEATQLFNTTSNEAGLNTFKPSVITMVPRTAIGIVTITDSGAFLYDFNQMRVMKQISLIDQDYYLEQDQANSNKFIVYTSVGDWPYSVHFITSYGVYIVDFKSNLTNQQEMLNDPSNFDPINTRLIRLQFDNFNNQIVSNKWGYAFIIKKYYSQTSFNIYLVVVGFFTNSNSKLVKMMQISQNEECISLNKEQNVPEQNDQINVNFVCGSYLYSYAINLRAHLNISLANFTNATASENLIRDDSSGKIKFTMGAFETGGVLSYSFYNLTVFARNTQSVQSVPVNLRFKIGLDASLRPLYIITTVAISCLVLLALVVFNMTAAKQLEKQGDENEDERNNSVIYQGQNQKNQQQTNSGHLLGQAYTYDDASLHIEPYERGLTVNANRSTNHQTSKAQFLEKRFKMKQATVNRDSHTPEDLQVNKIFNRMAVNLSSDHHNHHHHTSSNLVSTSNSNNHNSHYSYKTRDSMQSRNSYAMGGASGLGVRTHISSGGGGFRFRTSFDAKAAKKWRQGSDERSPVEHLSRTNNSSNILKTQPSPENRKVGENQVSTKYGINQESEASYVSGAEDEFQLHQSFLNME